uniref:Aprataxin C2HE/C2H2/C2HC zinc finger domain-containing protein n=1 Tax=Neobodo designis TaxID=312471 RepID=A0A7S1MSE6_NEODS|mmetsp:Transcript_45959/g.141559  ORF Transcript_45959/g.141559 Transcript_45959/m.141559 type:complete len:340 (+) Transcript_45959:46-1065(+)
MPRETHYTRIFDKGIAEFQNKPRVHGLSLPRTKLRMLLDSVTRTPGGVGGTAVRRDADTSSVSLCGTTLVRTAMAQHRARRLEKLHKDAWTSAPGYTREMAGDAVFHDDRVVVLADKYPKAAFHFLVVPRDAARLQSLNDLTRDDLGLLVYMRSVGDKVAAAVQGSACDAEEIRAHDVHYELFTPDPPSALELKRAREEHEWLSKDSVFDRSRPLALELPTGLLALPTTRVKFLQGFHSMPSLPPLHMHVISLDLLSATLKNKKHYNSFTTKFFLSSKAVEDDLAQFGSVGINQDVATFQREERKALECVWCGLACDSLPKLKRHIPACHKNAATLDSR